MTDVLPTRRDVESSGSILLVARMRRSLSMADLPSAKT
jgi:hypothetical protein